MKDVCRYCSCLCASHYHLAAHLRSCQSWIIWRDENLSSVTLQRMYVDEQRSTAEIAQIYDLPSVSVVLRQLKKFNIQLRTHEESVRTSRKQQRSQNTNLERYGSINPMGRNTKPRREMQRKLRETKGVDNVFQLPDVKVKIRDALCNQHVKISRYSKLHREIFEWLEAQRKDVIREFPIKFDTGYRSYDIKINSKLIEVQGDYWHANPQMYEPSAIIEWSMGKMTASDVWKRDEFKCELARLNGYDLLVVWESDWKSNRTQTEKAILNFVEGQNKHDSEIPKD